MKKITFFISIIISIAAFSQVTYNSTNFAQIGDSFIISKSSVGIQSFDFAVTGTNFNWDYSTLPVSTQETTTWDDPNTSNYKTTWCLSNGYILNCNTEFNNTFNLAKQALNGIEIQGFGITNLVDHYQLASTALENKMLGGSISVGGISIPLAIDYTAPDVVYQFPINYNDNYTNMGNYVIDLNSLGVPISYSTNIERTNIVEGWGSLITPFATFGNVLKMKTTMVQNIVIVTQDQTIPTTVTNITYKWFDPNYGIPVLEVTGEEISGQFAPTSVSYIDNQQCLDPTALFSYFPLLPEYDYITSSSNVSFFNLSTNYDQVEWDFGDGTIVTNDNPDHTFTCPGTYQVSLNITNEFCDPDLENSITIPVVITDPDGNYVSTVTVDNNTLTADRDTTGTTYQWIDCDNGNAPIPGETNQSFSPTGDGNYAVILTTNGCEDISNCYTFMLLGVEDVTASNISLLPNPTTGVLNLSPKKNVEIKKIEIYNMMGKLVSATLDITEQQSGVYFIRIETYSGWLTKKVIKI